MQANEPVQALIGKAIGRVPSGVFVLTSRVNGIGAGMLVSWVQQAAFSPPTITVAVAKGRPIGRLIRESRRLVVSVLGKGESALMRRFARTMEPSDRAFDEIGTIELPEGQVAMADALAYMDCRLASVCELAGDHEVFVAEVVGGDILKVGQAFVHQRNSGFHY